MALVEAPQRSTQERNAADAVIAALAPRYGNRLVTSQAVREQHGHTTTWIPNQPPDAVVFPQATEEVQEIVRLCAGTACRRSPSAPALRWKARSMRRAAASASISAT